MLCGEAGSGIAEGCQAAVSGGGRMRRDDVRTAGRGADAQVIAQTGGRGLGITHGGQEKSPRVPMAFTTGVVVTLGAVFGAMLLL